MGYAKRASKGNDFMDGVFWLIDFCWQVGAVFSLGCFGGFGYTIPGAFQKLAMADTDMLAQMFPKLYPISCFALPSMWLMLAAIFAWASHRSWMKKNQGPLSWS